MRILGISEGFHDAAVTLIAGNTIIYASHSERYSRIKNDKWIHKDQLVDCDRVIFYEKPLLKNTRRLFSGQGWKKRFTTLPFDDTIKHHWSHAAAAYYTRPWPEEPVCVVIDAIGEWDTASIWYKGKKKWSLRYPYSLGLFYSAMTQAAGLKPNEDEYITMGMAAYGEPIHNINPYGYYHQGINLKGRPEDIAASAQAILEKEVFNIMKRAREYSPYLCYGGGVALNCVANSKINNVFEKIWIMPNPGDAGSSLGAAAAYLGKQLKWEGPYLGTNIKTDVNPSEVAKHIHKYSVCGVAHGRAEFGPRALGNRSLLADPRIDIKDTVNEIKRRQKFRPFAPAILEEWAHLYFEGPMNEYMQFVATAKHDFHSVTHADGTARVQVVKKDCPSILRKILEEWYELTKCPMLLNTSLNIKGQPMVNTRLDADEFERKYNVQVF